jgi:acyl carrier protein
MKLVTFLEERFKITIEPSEASPKNFNTVAQLLNLVRAKLSDTMQKEQRS